MTDLQVLTPEELWHKYQDAVFDLSNYKTLEERIELYRTIHEVVGEIMRRLRRERTMTQEAEEYSKPPEAWAGDMTWGRHFEAFDILKAAKEAEEPK